MNHSWQEDGLATWSGKVRSAALKKLNRSQWEDGLAASIQLAPLINNRAEEEESVTWKRWTNSQQRFFSNRQGDGLIDGAKVDRHSTVADGSSQQLAGGRDGSLQEEIQDDGLAAAGYIKARRKMVKQQNDQQQCCGSMTFWDGSGSGSADPCL